MYSLLGVSNRVLAKLLTVTMLLFLLPAANAQELNPLRLRLETVDNSSGGPALDGFITNDLLIDTEDRLLSFQLALVLAEGTIYQDPLGTNVPPPELLTESFAPSLAFDTFVATGSQYANSPYGDGYVVGKAIDLEETDKVEDPRSVLMDSQAISIAWATTAGAQVRDVKDFLSSRITLSDDAKGYWKYLSGASFLTEDERDSTIYTTYSGLTNSFDFSSSPGLIKNGVMSFPENLHFVTNDRTPWPAPRGRGVFPLGDHLSVRQVDNSSGGTALEGYKTNDILSDFSQTNRLKWFQLFLELDQGDIYQDPDGNNTPPHEAIIEQGFPALEFDTFVGLGTDSAEGPYGIPMILGGASEIGGLGPSQFDEQKLNVGWLRYPDVIVGGFDDFLISRITLSDDALGEWRLLVSTSEGTGIVSGTIEDGFMEVIIEDVEEGPDIVPDPLENPFFHGLPSEVWNDADPLAEGEPGSIFIFQKQIDEQWTSFADTRFSKQARLDKQNAEANIPEPNALCIAAVAFSMLIIKRPLCCV